MLLLKRVAKMSDFVKKMAASMTKQPEMAERVQTNALNNVYAVEIETKLRQKVTIESSIENLENEMRKEIAQALKQSEDKVKAVFELAFEGKSV